jgi:hypothetical protein
MRPQFALPFTLAACLMFAAGAPAQSKKAEEAAKKAAKEQQKLTEAEVLGEAYILLASANHDYGGHCGKAMGQVIDAIKILDGNVLKKGTPTQKAMAAQEEKVLKIAKEANKHAGTIHEPQEASNAQLRAAAKMLGQIHGTLEATKQHKPAEHVGRAIKDIQEALVWQAKEAGREHEKFVESEALLKVYVMLAEADHDYDGHRAKAMGQVKDALKILDASIMKKGSPAEKAITAAEVTMAKVAVAARDKGPAIIEGQRASDKQIRAAHELLHKVKNSLTLTKQGRPLEHVEFALKELDIALKVK